MIGGLEGNQLSLFEPAFETTVITPSDTTVFPLHRGFHANTAGNIVLVDAWGATRTYVVLAGVTYMYGFTKILAATTATLIGIKFNTRRLPNVS